METSGSILAMEEALREKARAFDQEHLFAWWPELGPEQRESLLRQIASIDFELIASLVQNLVLQPQARPRAALEPAPIIPLPRSDADRQAMEQARSRGEDLLREGKVAALVVAGGQGTRLGFRGPKGAFPIGPLSQKPLFAFFAERILASGRRYGRPFSWYVMTSPANDDATRRFFEENGFFGLQRGQVRFFVQGSMPAVDKEGRILLASKHEIALSPDGHGGTLLALEKSGSLELMEAEGVEQISYFQVDNVLAKVLDPVFIGYHALAGAEMSSKVVRKEYPEEKVGIVGMRNGRLSVVEYSDLSEEDMFATGPDGGLKYWAGNIAIHMIQIAFLRRLQAMGIRLPFHRADKKVPYIDDQGRLVRPEKPNGIKFECFIFDALEHARNAITQEVSRKEEFSPVKNATGPDSPETAQRDLMELFASWLEAAGVIVPRNEDGTLAVKIEISPLFALDRDEALHRVSPDLTITGDLMLAGSA